MKAFILAAGFGKRLRPLTLSQPKPLLEVAGKPLIQHHIENLAAAGIKDLVINAHWLKGKLMTYLGDGSAWGVHIQWSVEEELLETGGGLVKALPNLGADPFLLVNGDVYIDYDFKKLTQHSLGDKLARLVLVPNPAHHPSGDFSFSTSSNLVRKQAGNDYTFAGVSLIDPKLLEDWASETEPFPLLSPLLKAVESGRLSGESYSGFWEDVGTIERLNALNEKLKKDQE